MKPAFVFNDLPNNTDELDDKINLSLDYQPGILDAETTKSGRISQETDH